MSKHQPLDQNAISNILGSRTVHVGTASRAQMAVMMGKGTHQNVITKVPVTGQVWRGRKGLDRKVVAVRGSEVWSLQYHRVRKDGTVEDALRECWCSTWREWAKELVKVQL